jgi:hypothetical protein
MISNRKQLDMIRNYTELARENIREILAITSFIEGWSWRRKIILFFNL